jgi:hypothetical protein
MSDQFMSSNMVRVINRNEFVIEDMFDGVPYTFPPGTTVTVDPPTAQHIFGYPGDPDYMHLYMSKRWGWNDPKIHHERDRSNLPLWKRWCQKVEIKPITFDLVERDADPNAPIPAELGDAAVDVTDRSHTTESEPSAATRTGRGRRRPRTPAALGNQRKPQAVNM